MLQLLYMCRKVETDSQAQTNDVKVAALNVGSAIENLAAVVTTSSEKTRDFVVVVEMVQTALDKINDTTTSLEALDKEDVPVSETYQMFAHEVVSSGKLLTDALREVLSKSSKPVASSLSDACHQLSSTYVDIYNHTRKAAQISNEKKIKESLIDSLRDLGFSIVKLVDMSKQAVVSVGEEEDATLDPATRQKVGENVREVSQRVGRLVTIAKEGSKTIRECDTFIQQVTNISMDIDGQIIFAQAGQLDPLDRRETFELYKDDLLKLSKELLEHSRGIVFSTITQRNDTISELLNTSVQRLMTLDTQVKKAAIAISSNDRTTQEKLLLAYKSMMTALLGLIEATKVTLTLRAIELGENSTSPKVNALRDKAMEFETSMADLEGIINQVGDETKRIPRSLENAIKDISQGVMELSSEAPAQGTAMPEEVVTCAKSLATAAAQLVSIASRATSDQTQEEFISATNELRGLAVELLRSSKAVAVNAPEANRSQMHGAASALAQATISMLDKIRNGLSNPTNASRTSIQAAAKDIAQGVSRLVEAASAMVTGGYVDPSDPNYIAERELLAAASSIEAAARKLAALKPPERPREANEDLNFEEQILEAAKAIAAATGALVRSATSAQREIAAMGKNENTKKTQMYYSDGTWSEGLVSAAKKVATATGDLCEAANQAVKGEVRREQVIAAARAVSSSTVQLLTAAAVRADPNSQAQIRLKAAGKSVTQATEQLVKAAEESMALEQQEDAPSSLVKDTGGYAMQRAKELEAQARVLQMEKELEMARKQLMGLRKGKYTQNQ